MIDPAPLTTPITDSLISPIWGRFMRAISDFLQGSGRSIDFVPTIVGITGAYSVTASYTKIGRIVYIAIIISPSGSITIPSGSTVTLPSSGIDLGGILVTQGYAVMGIAQISSGLLLLPSITTSSPISILGTYRGDR